MTLLLAALLASSGSQVGNPAGLPTQSLHTPDLIAPAVLPYLACLYAARGLPLLRGTDGRPIGAAKPGPNGDCSAARRNARQQAMILVRGKQLPNNLSPEDFVADALSDIDDYVASLPPPNAQNYGGHLPVVEATPVAIEDEVQPAYTKYNECLRNKVKESPVTAANVLGKFSDALIACREVRRSALKEAADALAPRGWDQETRRKAADNTFAKADESWSTMGRRLHDALLRRDAMPKAHSRSKQQ